MPNINLKTLENEKDKHGVRIGDWATQASPGYAQCQVCVPAKVLSFAKGKKDLTQHSEGAKHRKAWLDNKSNNNLSQPSLTSFMNSKSSDNVQQKARDLENALCLMISRHGFQHTIVDCLVDILKTYVTDSEIIKKVRLGKDKAGYIINHGLGEHFEQETISLIKNCNALGASIDESEVIDK